MKLIRGASPSREAVVKITWGATRLVFLIFGIAIKIPKPKSMWSLRKGFASNRKEHFTWKTRHPTLCPILWSDCFGCLVVMRRAKPIDEGAFQHIPFSEMLALLSVYGQTACLPVEMKASSFGMLEGKLVAVDYGEVSPTIPSEAFR